MSPLGSAGGEKKSCEKNSRVNICHRGQMSEIPSMWVVLYPVLLVIIPDVDYNRPWAV